MCEADCQFGRLPYELKMTVSYDTANIRINGVDFVLVRSTHAQAIAIEQEPTAHLTKRVAKLIDLGRANGTLDPKRVFGVAFDVKTMSSRRVEDALRELREADVYLPANPYGKSAVEKAVGFLESVESRMPAVRRTVDGAKD